MIVVESFIFNQKEFTHTYSDRNKEIHCVSDADGVNYDDAYDVPNSGRQYVETEIDIPVPDEDEEENEENGKDN